MNATKTVNKETDDAALGGKHLRALGLFWKRLERD